jgi:hypothetical protein
MLRAALLLALLYVSTASVFGHLAAVADRADAAPCVSSAVSDDTSAPATASARSSSVATFVAHERFDTVEQARAPLRLVAPAAVQTHLLHTPLLI